jgi:hypothetical protein
MVVAGVLSSILSSCGGPGPGATGQAYRISLGITGTPEAFAGRRVLVGEADVEAVITGPTVPNLRAEAVETQVDRVGCALSPDGPGREEWDTIVLRPDGTIDAEFGKSIDVHSTCLPDGSFVCPGETL